MPNLVEIIDIAILGIAAASLIVSVLKIKSNKKKAKKNFGDKRELK